ncbi:hypothetical protein [Desulfocucumis palustris]|nr:hypothetical protein [Desulfocucumis palustris]
MRRLFSLFTLLIILTMFLSGCNTNENKANSNKGIVYIYPSNLFKGDTKILQPHLDIIGGCVKIQYKGTKKFIGTSIELWENGKIKSTLNPFYSKIDGTFDGEVSVSLRDEGPDNASSSFKEVTEISQNGGYSSSTCIIPRFSSSYQYGPKELSGSKEVTDNEATAVWGLMAEKGATATYSNDESIEEMAKRVDWAFVLKVSFSDNTKN